MGCITTASANFSLKLWFDEILQSFMNGKSITHLHFNFWKFWRNDFGGILFTVWTKDVVTSVNEDGSIVGEKIERLGQEITCSKQLQGFFYTSQRGERIWPLDTDTKNNNSFFFNGLTMTGGIYTHCTGANIDTHSFFGHITHEYSGDTYGLTVWVKYDPENNTIITGEGGGFANNLQSFNNQYNLWLLYDYNGGIGGWGLEFILNPNEYVTTTNTYPSNRFFHLNDGRDTYTWMDWSPITGDNIVFVGRYCDKMEKYHPGSGNILCQLLSGTNSTNGTWINVHAGSFIDQLLLLKIQGIIGMSTDVGDKLKDIAGNEKDSKTQYFSSVNVNNATLINAAKKKAGELCTTNTSNNSNIICIENMDTEKNLSELKGKTIIVQNGNLTLKGKMSPNDNGINVFVDKGKLIFKFDSSEKVTFNEKGFVDTNTWTYQGIYLKGNFIVNGLVEVETGDFKYFIHGKFTSLNTYSASQTPAARINQIRQLFNWKINPNTTDQELASKIDLTQVFKWRCNYENSTDGSPCNEGDFANSPLNIINQTIPSPFF